MKRPGGCQPTPPIGVKSKCRKLGLQAHFFFDNGNSTTAVIMTLVLSEAWLYTSIPMYMPLESDELPWTSLTFNYLTE